MKKLVILIGVMLVAQASFSQIFTWGVKAGVNSTKVSFDDFSIENDITIKPDYLPGGPNEDDLIISPDGETQIVNPQAINRPGIKFEPKSYEMGYHFGAFARLKVLGIYIQPELIFSHAEASIDFSDTDNLAGELESSTATIKYNSFDIPV
ncbi:MAG TPA: outer membrane beta-barrel protein, partial [Salinivirga sp.]|uniref:outer membrane beta-barrel protein n=1 Tax=Salinivirga sp. TaxID=1970192 RepID=UPI002B4A3CC4